MIDSVLENLILDLVEWLATGERRYEEVMAAWRTSCPNLQVWEEASDRGLVTTDAKNGPSIVRVTPPGTELLRQSRPSRIFADGGEKAT